MTITKKDMKIFKLNPILFISDRIIKMPDNRSIKLKNGKH